MSRIRRITVSLVAAAFALAGCNAPDNSHDNEVPPPGGVIDPDTPLRELPLLDDPKSFQGQSTAWLANDDIEPIAENPEQHLPVTVTSYDRTGERQVAIEDTSRVISLDLTGAVSGTIWGLGFGDTLVARGESTLFSGVADLPTVTTGGISVNTESVINMRPTLVIADGSIGPVDVVEQLRDVGITVVFVRNEPSFDGALELARDIGEIYGAPELGEQMADQLEAELERTMADIAAIAPQNREDKLRIVFLYLRGSSGIYYLFGSESGADQLIEALGAIDVAGELGWQGMRPLTDEAVVSANPDVFLVMTGGLESVGGVDQLMEDRTALALTNAGQNRRIVDMEDGQVLSFGPRAPEVLDALARALYAPNAVMEDSDS